MGAVLTSQTASRLAGVEGVPSGNSADTLLNETARNSLGPGVLEAMRRALAGALHDVYLMMLLSAIMAFLLVLFFPRGRAEDLGVTKAPSAFAAEEFVVEPEEAAAVGG